MNNGPSFLDEDNKKPEKLPEVDVTIVQKPRVNFRLKYPDKMIISNSNMKQLIYKGDVMDHCPLRIMQTEYYRNYLRTKSESMVRGIYFETNVLGCGAGGSKVFDLPRKSLTNKSIMEQKAAGIRNPIGDKTAVHQRIDIQIERFHIKAHNLGVVITDENVQVPILKHLWDNVYYMCIYDIFPTVANIEGKTRPCIIDVKLTGDIHNTFRRGMNSYTWGDPSSMDHMQAIGQLESLKDIDVNLNEHLKDLFNEFPSILETPEMYSFLYWVWGYDKLPLENQDKFVEVIPDKLKIKEFYESARKYVHTIEMYSSSSSIPVNPKHEHCKDCPVNINRGGFCNESNSIHKV